MRYSERAKLCKNPLAQKLLLLMEEKQTNLCPAADFSKSQELLELADKMGPDICMFKTHIDIVEDFTPGLTKELRRLSEKHRFLIFEDRKFADIGNTVKSQYSKGIYKISDWAHIVNAHIVSGPGVIDGLKEIGLPKGNALILLAEMSSKGALATGDYTKTAINWAEANANFVIGFITTKKITDNPTMIHFTPGVKLTGGTDNLRQQYNTPEKVIAELGSDVIIVGRGIYQADDPIAEAKKYRKTGWEAYLNRL
ncbi:MAG: orotidine-5'-phosphate decarboxylase [Candidatus Doudnabacteria bacterium CG10_big_fil_rev_8_21_14_0_10_41_10]|uniref:Orotidine 5'-phosphate decarboxylase n=1 Tax=Candidatus Doudnabacteria bacterium CG10_big_fil_rev_8_21_14_0_10_41_10 TaxID=1974551 RepID=A0A2H0VCL4_9BACT|nr:MAG: orotidine-5'-phosphate decarboxylase [Candidatus Doudnabacteria bacterium CG10_big_fil_rev_8_21_14_0_10_41_10]